MIIIRAVTESFLFSYWQYSVRSLFENWKDEQKIPFIDFKWASCENWHVWHNLKELWLSISLLSL